MFWKLKQKQRKAQPISARFFNIGEYFKNAVNDFDFILVFTIIFV